MEHEALLILDYGSQYTQLIARRARELGVRSEIRRYDLSGEELQRIHPKAIVLSGGPASVADPNAPRFNPDVLTTGVPILGICYGMQLLAHELGGSLERSNRREYGLATLTVRTPGTLLTGIPAKSRVWASHGDHVGALPSGFTELATTESGICAAAEDAARLIALIQFHPEVAHTDHGTNILKNFLFGVAKFRGDYTPESALEETLTRIRTTVGSERVVCALSGGVDSSVVAALLHRAVPGQVRSIFVDHGLLRRGEAGAVRATMRSIVGDELTVVDATKGFLAALHGIADPEEKRKIIGKLFIEVFEETSRGWGASFLAQGTLYPDVIESSGVRGTAATIKTHHNVGGLPERMNLKLLEPLREFFKDEVRALGRKLSLPEGIVGRHPFPGPGLAVRILGPITPEALDTLGQADAIFIEELRTADLYDKVWQAFAVLLPVRSVGVMGDERTYDNAVALRAVTSSDGMTADWAALPSDFLARVSSRIVNEVPGVNRVVYDITSKPPSTIEWE